MSVLDFYRESARVANPMFDIHDEDEDADPLEPNIKYGSTYSIKSISANIRPTEDGYDVTYSKSTRKWETFLPVFFEDVFNKPDPFGDEYRKRTGAVEDIVESAFEALEDDESSDEDVIETLDSEIDSVAEDASQSETAEESEYEPDELEEIYDSLELVGISVKGAEDALTDKFTVSSTATLRDWTDKNVSANDSLKRVLDDAEPDSVGFIFRGQLRGEDSPAEDFILQDGVWKSASGGISDDASELLNILFQSNDE